MSDSHHFARNDTETRELITTFRTSLNEAERDRALEAVTIIHMPLARSLAHRYAGRGLDREDLEQVAFLALLKAIHRFDLDKPTEFGAYATPTITGELRRHFRDHGWLVRPPRALQERRQLVSEARARLEQDLGHDPEIDELAHELDLTVESVREAQVAASNLRPASLDATTAEGSRPVLDLIDARADSQTDPALDDGIVVRTAIERLPARDQTLVELRFGDDLTQAEIAETMGLSAMQVSRLLRRTLDDLRVQLDADGVATA
ncbi:RNA polymerase sigma factor [Intrasporangium oryzae NRRL B-24470]|uniref:RNA polymerase sigma factor n=1 Tax=Intrasporangium oryzae NRRL B-24470 TaxID=1386089 RepID=W9G5U0_9MICO|nr:sigma-70 family RNA polymerase sigma factor [Intrasporangium oryzae]EWT01405.1 RNA polymerase sigma factor [Intrasporangium oryzae NRRL B-24470]